MNTRQLIALAALALAGTAAGAHEITVVDDTFRSTRSRAEVMAGVLEARAAGVREFFTESYAEVPRAQPVAALTRSDVRARLLGSPRMSAGELAGAV